MNSNEIIGLSCIAFTSSILSGLALSCFRYKKRKKEIDFIQSINLKTKLLENGDLDWEHLNTEDLVLVNVIKKSETGNIYGNLL